MENCDAVCNAGCSRLSGHDHTEQVHSANSDTQPQQQQQHQHMADKQQTSVKLNLRLSLNNAAVTINDNCCMVMLETCLWQSDTPKRTTKKIQKSESCAGSKGPGTHDIGVHGVTFLLMVFVSRVMTWQGTGGAVSGYHVPAVPCTTTGVQHNKSKVGSATLLGLHNRHADSSRSVLIHWSGQTGNMPVTQLQNKWQQPRVGPQEDCSASAQMIVVTSQHHEMEACGKITQFCVNILSRVSLGLTHKQGTPPPCNQQTQAASVLRFQPPADLA